MADTRFEIDKDRLEVRITRVFSCTPERLWKAHTTASEIEKWWADTVVDKFEVKVGGAWRFVSQGQDGKQHAFRGEFKELDEPKKIVRTFEYEPYAGNIMVETLLLEPTEDGKTKQITLSKYENLQQLEGMVGMGMEEGADAGLNRLAQLVENN